MDIDKLKNAVKSRGGKTLILFLDEKIEEYKDISTIPSEDLQLMQKTVEKLKDMVGELKNLEKPEAEVDSGSSGYE